jgi:hypothetical protein
VERLFTSDVITYRTLADATNRGAFPVIDSKAKAKANGYTREVFASSDQVDLELLVQPGTDFDGRFYAYDTNGEELIVVYGWLFTVEAGGCDCPHCHD